MCALPTATTPTAHTVDKGYTGSVQNPSLSLATPTVTLVSGQAASAQLATNGGVAPHIYATEPSGTPMPFELSLSSGGLITGTPSSTGTANILLRVTDASTGPRRIFRTGDADHQRDRAAHGVNRRVASFRFRRWRDQSGLYRHAQRRQRQRADRQPDDITNGDVGNGL